MKKLIKLSIIIMALFIVITGTSPSAYAAPKIPAGTNDFYVNDFANVFSDEEKDTLMQRAVDLATQPEGIQIVVTTIKSLGDNSIEDYANAMYNQYGIGKDDMGLLILLSTEDREIRVETGKSMESYINDSKAGRFIDKYAIPKLKDDKFNEGLLSLQDEFIKEIKTVIKKEKSSPIEEKETPKPLLVLNSNDIAIAAVFFIFIGAIIGIILTIRKKTKIILERDEEISRLLFKLNNIEHEFSQKNEILAQENRSISGKMKKITNKYNELNDKFIKLNDRYTRGKILFPNIDEMINEMIEEEVRQYDMKKAASFDTNIQQFYSLSASKENVTKFEKVLNEYEDLNKEQKSYIKSDIKIIKSLYEQSKQLQYKYFANAAATSISAIISKIKVAKEENIRDLEKANNLYNALNPNSKEYFDKNILEKVAKFLTQAKKDKEENEERERIKRIRLQEEEEQRRLNSYNSNDNFGGSSGFGGFGGTSGGGGASRGF